MKSFLALLLLLCVTNLQSQTTSQYESLSTKIVQIQKYEKYFSAAVANFYRNEQKLEGDILAQVMELSSEYGTLVLFLRDLADLHSTATDINTKNKCKEKIDIWIRSLFSESIFSSVQGNIEFIERIAQRKSVKFSDETRQQITGFREELLQLKEFFDKW